ncbi:MAG: phytoene/squalene synthase family protein [Phycisphaeraceae bacterium]|nr:phytoene/squalene synthase family protein [Phycisphaeraceae bacterium]
MSTVAPISLGPPTEALLQAARACEEITRRRARNFYYGLRLTPEPERFAMFIIYAWMRQADDLADAGGAGPEERCQRIAEFRAATDAAFRGQPVDDSPLWIGFSEVTQRWPIRRQDFHDMLDGQLADIRGDTHETWDDLRRFCYRVASTVGLICIHVWGFNDPEAPKLAIDRGIAFQLTNVLRDFREDFDKGHVYLPARDFEAMELTPEMVRRWTPADRCTEFIKAQADRARAHYQSSLALDGMITQSCEPTLWAMTTIYRGLLEKILADPERVVRERRIRLSAARKAWIAFRARFKAASSGRP